MAEAITDHRLRVQAPQQREQVVRVAPHQGAGEEHRLAALARQYTEGLALRRAFVLVLVSLIGHQQAEIALREIALDELGGLVATLAERELHVGKRALHPLRLPVAEHQFAVLVHQVDELVDIVPQHAGQQILAEAIDQPVGRDGADGGQAHQRGMQQVPP